MQSSKCLVVISLFFSYSKTDHTLSRIHQKCHNTGAFSTATRHPINPNMASQATQDELYKRDANMKFLWESGDLVQVYARAEHLTGKYAERLLREAKMDQVASDQDLVVLDEACGTGAISSRLLDMLSNESRSKLDLTMTDRSQPMIDIVHKRIEANNWQNIKVLTADAADTKLPSSHFTHIFLNFGPFIFADPQVGLAEIYRMLRPGGTVGFSSHGKVGWIADVTAAWKTDPELPPFPTDEGLAGMFGKDIKWNDPAWIKETLAKAGFVDVEVTPSDLYHIEPNATTTFKMLLPGTVEMITNTVWTQELRDKHGQRANDVSCRYIEEKYGDGDLGWDWTALLTTAKKPT
jgi:ubiquinone/menaquinone biosynthesis C-methylase UbiE